MKKIKTLLHKYNHAWILLYFFIYMIWFFYINQRGVRLHPIESPLDAKIPFCEWFILPYYLWFAYVPLTIAYFFFTSKKEFYQCTSFLFIGMTICMITYTIWPNVILFRPDLDTLGRDNILIRLTAFIYKADTGANACPSIHCFNSIGLFIAIAKSTTLKKHRSVQIGSFILSALICLSTLFVKQHSVIDVFWAFVLAAAMYLLVYIPDYQKIFPNIRTERSSKKVVFGEEQK